MLYFTDDPLNDFARHDAEEVSWIDSRPICSDCGNPIQGNHFYEFERKIICEKCLDMYYKKDIFFE